MRDAGSRYLASRMERQAVRECAMAIASTAVGTWRGAWLHALASGSWALAACEARVFGVPRGEQGDLDVMLRNAELDWMEGTK